MVNKVLKLAQSWVGKNEKDGSFKEIIDIYNTQKPLPRSYKVKYTDEWCATTVSALAVKLGITDIMPTECSCQKMIDKYKAIGCWQENESIIPKAGYILFYDWQDNGKGNNTGWADHVGIVEKVSGSQITIIEGNYNSKVARRTITVNAKYIRGYAIPKYETEAKVEVKPTVTVTVSPYYAKYTGKSYHINDVFRSIGVEIKFIGNVAKRKPIAIANGISNYTGTYSQNVYMIKLAKEGKLVRP